MKETRLILAAVLGQYQLALAPGQGEPAFQTQITLSPKGGVRVTMNRVAPREKAAHFG